jgi:hypothetical protein
MLKVLGVDVVEWSLGAEPQFHHHPSFPLLLVSSVRLRQPFLFHISSSLHPQPSIAIMLSLRTLARSVPRTVSRSLAVSSRSAVLRPVSSVPKFSFNQISKPACAAFSTSSVFRQAAAEGKCPFSAVIHGWWSW